MFDIEDRLVQVLIDNPQPKDFNKVYHLWKMMAVLAEMEGKPPPDDKPFIQMAHKLYARQIHDK